MKKELEALLADPSKRRALLAAASGKGASAWGGVRASSAAADGARDGARGRCGGLRAAGRALSGHRRLLGQGRIRAVRGQCLRASEIRYKDCDSDGSSSRAEPDRLLGWRPDGVLLPRDRQADLGAGLCEPLNLLIDLARGSIFLALLVHRPRGAGAGDAEAGGGSSCGRARSRRRPGGPAGGSTSRPGTLCRSWRLSRAITWR